MKSNKKLHQNAHSAFSASDQSIDHDRKNENVLFQSKQQFQQCLCDEMY